MRARTSYFSPELLCIANGLDGAGSLSQHFAGGAMPGLFWSPGSVTVGPVGWMARGWLFDVEKRSKEFGPLQH